MNCGNDSVGQLKPIIFADLTNSRERGGAAIIGCHFDVCLDADTRGQTSGTKMFSRI